MTGRQHEEIETMKLRTAKEKSALEHKLGDLRSQVKSLEEAAQNSKNRVAQMEAKKETNRPAS